MRLVRAQIDGFGRYAGETFEFDGGLNVVYGKNEAGKSTLQQFILAMLYGMKKPGRKRAVYLEEEAKYRPWHGGTYGGILWVEQAGVVYRIERSLRREDEWVRVYRQDSGEDLTARFPVDSRKELTFAQILWQADRDLFVNTCCIGPLDERERAARLLESARQGEGNQEMLATPEQVKIRTAEEAIGKRLEMLGSERAASKPYAQTLKKRDDLKKMYNEAQERDESQRGARMSAEELTEEWQAAVRDEQVLRDRLASKLARYLNVQEAGIGERKGRLEMLTQTIEQSRQTVEQAVDEGVFQEMQQDFQRLINAKGQSDSYQKRLAVLAEEARDAQELAKQHQGFEENSLPEVERIASRLDILESSVLEEPGDERENGEEETLHTACKSERRKMWVTAAATVLVAPFGLLKWWLFALVFVLLAFGLSCYFAAGRAEERRRHLQGEREKREETLRAARAEQERLEIKLQDKLTAFGVDTPRQYRQKWNTILKAREQVAQYEKQVAWLTAEASRAQGERDIVARRLLRHLGTEDRQPSQLDAEQLRAEISHWEERFEEFRELRGKIGVWERERDRLLYEIEGMEKELERWREVAAQMDARPEPPSLFAPTPITGLEVDKFYQSWQEAERIRLEKQSTYKEAETRYNTLREGSKPPAEILLEPECAETEASRLTLEREALLLAQQVWGEVKEELYQAVAPRFAATLSTVTDRITKGRYQEVYLDREKSISTVSPDSGYTVDLETLSSGTIDQITFALGLSMSSFSIQGGERLPLLLDEPFRRYDDDRLEAALDLLFEEGEERQILLFTCREQEAERVVARGDARVTVIELSEKSMV